MRPLNFRGRMVGPGFPCMVVGELSCNHGGSLETARKTVAAMKQSGVDCVKLQTARPDWITLNCTEPGFVVSGGTPWDGMTLHQLYTEAHTPWAWHEELRDLCRSLGLLFMSSPFDLDAVDFLDELDVCAFKIASFEVTDIELIAKAASKGRPLIISTGIAGEQEISEALATARGAGNDQIILTKCVSSYPAPVDAVNLGAIKTMAELFDTHVGLSDHSLEPWVPALAVSAGACLVEKHFILDRKLGGPDSAFSLEPTEWKIMVDHIRYAERAMGNGSLDPGPSGKKGRMYARSLIAIRDIAEGEPFTRDNLRSLRPGTGLHPRYLPELLKTSAKIPILRGTPVDWNMVEGDPR